MAKFVIETTIPSRKSGGSNNIWFPFLAECDGLAEAHRLLAEDGCLIGERVVSREFEGRRYVLDRVPHIIGIGMIAMIRQDHTEHVDGPAPEQSFNVAPAGLDVRA